MHFSIQKTDAGTSRDHIILDAMGRPVKAPDGVVVIATERDAAEIAAALSEGVPTSELFASDDHGYGGPLHAELGDQWFYGNCPEAW